MEKEKKLKDIAIITYSRAYNYGSALQAYALYNETATSYLQNFRTQ